MHNLFSGFHYFFYFDLTFHLRVCLTFPLLNNWRQGRIKTLEVVFKGGPFLLAVSEKRYLDFYNFS